MAHCTKCGISLRAGAKFCPQCRAPVREDVKKDYHSKKSPAREKHQNQHNLKKDKQKTKAIKSSGIKINKRTFILQIAAKAMAKSLALSVAVLGPGFVLLANDYVVLGMIWLFSGSFGMMAWTYRKPWRLMWVTCLTPPVISLICYLLQLLFFSEYPDAIPPPELLISAVIAGGVVGYFRAKSHQVYQQDGNIMAQRTVKYLLIWMLAYGCTQLLAMVSKNIYVVAAGLTTGAFTTMMLFVISVSIFSRFRRLKKQITSIASFIIPFMFLSVLSAAVSFPAKAEPVPYPDQIISKMSFGSGFALIESNKVRDKHSKIFSDPLSIVSNVYRVNNRPKDFAFLVSLTDYGNKKDALRARDASIKKAKKKSVRNITKQINLPEYAFLNFGMAPSGKEGAILFSHGRWLYASTMRGVHGKTYKWMENFMVTQAKNFLKHLPTPSAGKPSFSRPSGQTNSKSHNWDGAQTSSPGTGLNSGGGDDPDKHKINLDEEEARVVVATIATILIASGIAVQIANSIAVALSQAIQSGVEFTAEEINNAMVNGLDNENFEDDLNVPDPPPKVVEDIEEKRQQKGPVLYDKEGEKFERNEQGKYWSPDDKGDWVWMDEGDARESSAALRGERVQREAEQLHHDRETEAMLSEARERIRAQNRLEEEAYLREKLQRELQEATQSEHRERLVTQTEKMAEREGGELKREIDQLVKEEGYAGLEDLYRERLEKQITSGHEDSANEQSWEKNLAVGENVSRAVVAASKGALMVAGGPAGAAATGLAVGSVSAAEEGAESYVRGDSLGKVVAKTAGGFLSGAKDGAVSVYTNFPGTGKAAKLLVPAGADALETYVRTGDGKQALVSAGVSLAGDVVGGKLDALGNVVGRELGRASVTVAAAETTNYAAGGKFGDAYQTALVNHLGGKMGSRAGTSLVSRIGTLDSSATPKSLVDNEQRVREALDGVQAAKKDIPLEQQAKVVQELEQSRYKEVDTDESGRPLLDNNGNEITTEFVNTRKSLEQLQDPASSRSAKMGPKALKQAMIETRQKKIYDPADAETIRRVTPALEQTGLLKPGDEVVMDSFSTPGQKPSLGADRDARLVIKRPNGKPLSSTEDGFDRIEIKREHWENIAHEDFFKHTTKIAESGGQKITPESHPEYFRRRAEMEFMRRPDTPEAIAKLQSRGYSQEQIAKLQQQGMTQKQIDHKAWAEAHNQLFTDRHHMEASADNADQAFSTIDRDLKKVQVESNIMPVGRGETTLHDAEGFARMWAEKSRFYDENPPEALAQSQKGIGGLIRARDGYRAQNLIPPPFTEQTAKAMEIVAKAKVGADATPESIAEVDRKLRDLGYKDLNDGLAKIAYQNELLKWSTKVKGLGSSDLTRISQSSLGLSEDIEKGEES